MTRRHFGGPSAQPLGRRLAFRPKVLSLEDRSLPDTTPVEPPADPADTTTDPADTVVTTTTTDPADTTTTDPADTTTDPTTTTTTDPADTTTDPPPGTDTTTTEPPPGTDPTTDPPTTDPPAPAPTPSTAAPYLAVGAETGNRPLVKVYDTDTGRVKYEFLAYDESFKGGVRVATGDVTGDGVDDVITAPGYGGGPLIKVFDGATGAELTRFMAYNQKFRGGVYVAAGDVNADGHADIITGAGDFGGPHVKVFNGAWAVPPIVIQNPADQPPATDDGEPPPADDTTDPPADPAPQVTPPPVDTTTAVFHEFMAYGERFRGGVRVAAGDVNGDGRADIITAAGSGGGPHVRVIDGQTFQAGPEWMAYGLAFTGGVYVSAGDLNGDGKAEVVTGTGARGATQVRIFRGETGVAVRGFTASPIGTTASVRVAVVDFDQDGRNDLLTSHSTTIQVRDGQTGMVRSTVTPFDPSVVRHGLSLG